MRFQSVFSRVAFGGFLLALVIELTGAFGIKFGWWEFEFGQRLILASSVIGTAALLSAIAWLACALLGNTSAGWRLGALALIGAAVLTYGPLDSARQFFIAPPLHDISTDIENAPAFEALLPLRAAAHADNQPLYDGKRIVSFQGKRMTAAIAQKMAYPDIKVLGKLVAANDIPKGATAQSIWFWHAFETAKRMGWTIVAFDARAGRIEATDTSFWSGITDDIVIRVTPIGHGGARIDIRSAARHGDFDYGRDAARVRDYLNTLNSK
jgi:hypothetical protein